MTGGTGFVGQTLVPALIADGHAVTILTRRTTPLDGPLASARLVHWSGPPDDIPDDALGAVDAIINLAGESVGGGRWTANRKDTLFKSRVETTRWLVAMVDQLPQKPRVFISASAVGYYGPRGDEEITEASQPGDDFLATLCMHWEDEAKAIVKHEVRLALLRIGLVLGPGGGVLPRLMLPFRFFAGGPLGSGRQVMSWIHIDDLVAIVRFVLDNESISGPLNVTAPNPQTNREFAKALGRAMHRPSLLPVPAFVLRLVLGEMSDSALTGQRAIPKRLTEHGFQFQYPELDDALRDIL
jgi:uncharacterized protein (TIGR01777 family)